MIICAQTAAIEIACKYEKKADWFVQIAGDNNSLACLVQNMEVLTPWEVVTKEKSDSKRNEGNNNLKALIKGIGFSALNIRYIPFGIEKVFPSLEKMFFASCNVIRVRQANFKPFTELSALWLSENPHLDTLEKGLFDYNKKLERLSLSNNNFKYIDANIFEGLNSLKSIACESFQTNLQFKSLVTTKFRNLEVSQNHFDHILREDRHKQMAIEIQKMNSGIETIMKPLKQKGRLDKLKWFTYNKILANFTTLLSEIQVRQKRKG